MKVITVFVSALVSGLLATAAPAAVIDFDSAPASFTSYSEAGATITASGQNISRLGSPNGTNGILSQGSPRAVFRADFSSAASFVAVDLGDFNADPDTIFLSAYDSANTLLGSVSLLLSPSDATMHTLAVSEAGISYVLFGATSPALNGSSVLADNLTFTLGAAIPEPASWAMMIIGFGAAGAAARRRPARKALLA